MLAHLAPSVLLRSVQHLTVHRWAVGSQQQARRNAMLAATECAQRRIERDEVADYLASRYPDQHPAPRPTHRPAHRPAHGDPGGADRGRLRRSQG